MELSVCFRLMSLYISSVSFASLCHDIHSQEESQGKLMKSADMECNNNVSIQNLG